MNKGDRQFELFDTRDKAGTGTVSGVPKVPLSCPDSLDDEGVLRQLPYAGVGDVQPLCNIVVERRFGDRALPALELLWCRFSGFGKDRIVVEQKVVIETLARLDTQEARARLARIVTERDLPRPLLITGLRAARSASLKLPKPFVASLMDDHEPQVRELAIVLSELAGPDIARLKACLADPQYAVRKAAAIVMGKLGFDADEARTILLSELRRCPMTAVINALLAIADDDIAVHLGRCAQTHPEFAEIIMIGLEDMETDISRKIVRRIRTNLQQLHSPTCATDP